MGKEFNHALCEERHEKIGQWEIKMDKRMKSVENRFLAIMTALVLNLTGVIVLLLRTVI